MFKTIDFVFEVSWDDMLDWDGEALYAGLLDAKIGAEHDYDATNFQEPGEHSWYPVGKFYWHHCDAGLPTGVVIKQRSVYEKVKN